MLTLLTVPSIKAIKVSLTILRAGGVMLLIKLPLAVTSTTLGAGVGGEVGWRVGGVVGVVGWRVVGVAVGWSVVGEVVGARVGGAVGPGAAKAMSTPPASHRTAARPLTVIRLLTRSCLSIYQRLESYIPA